MNADRHRAIGDLYHQALDLPPESRETFLRNACLGDDGLLREVESLLSAHDRAGDFITTPAIQLAAAALAADNTRPMPVDPAGFSRIGQYEIVALLGRGGMGEVYRGHDPRLGRDVALKVLSDGRALDARHIERFEREARALASLNHPNIAVLYGVEDAHGCPALVMELVEGVPLRERILSGPIPLDEVLAIARQVGEALEAAHDHGFIHRDLKPANIMLRPDGTVKVLDFGLAKEIAPLGDRHAHPHITTHSGTRAIIGTASYMSPEQARGAVVDQRTDIWAFGCVLYEMLTGEPAFAGDTTSDIVAKIIEHEPDFSALPAKTPPAVQRLLRRCLKKNVRERLRHSGDAVLELSDVIAAPTSDLQHTVAPVARPVRNPSLWIPASLVAVTLIAGAWWIARRDPPAAPVSRFAVALPSTTPLVVTLGPSVAISSDGQYFAVRSNGGTWSIRRRDRLDGVLVGGNGVFITLPFFSPDGNWLAFADGDSTAAPATVLKKVPVRGGTPQPIVDVPATLLGAAWGTDNRIVFATTAGLFGVGADGGVPETLLPANQQRRELFSWPAFLPGGEWLLFTVTGRGTALAARLGDGSLEAVNVRTGARRTILPGVTHATYIPTGHLVYASGGTLYAVRFDANRLEVQGEAVPLIADVRDDDFAMSAEGTLAYISGAGGRRQLTWVDRSGREEVIAAPPRRYLYPSLSPDGTKVALDIDGSNRDIWILDLGRDTLTRLTDDPEENLMPVWSPDGAHVAFGRRVGNSRLYWQQADGSGAATPLSDTATSRMPLFFTPDGKQLIFVEQARDVLALSLDGSEKVSPLLVSPARELNAVVSPDGSWTAYAADDTGQFEVFVRPFPDANGGKWQVSRGGGTQPLWSRDGRELYYRDQTGAVLAVPVRLRPSFASGPALKLFEGGAYAGAGNVVQARTYDVSPDGRRFLMIKLSPNRDNELPANYSLVLVQHWFDEVRRLTR